MVCGRSNEANYVDLMTHITDSPPVMSPIQEGTVGDFGAFFVRRTFYHFQLFDEQLQALRVLINITVTKSELMKMAADVAVSIVLSWSAATCVPFRGPSMD